MVTPHVSKLVGAPVKRKEDPRLVTGGGKYTDDVQFKGLAYMGVLRSSHAHARIRRIDTARLSEHPDVLDVLTGEEVKERCKVPFPLLGVREGMRTKSRFPMAATTAKYVGEPVAAVVATSRASAKDALELIAVEYEPLPVVVDLEEAAGDSSPLVHEDLGTNLCVDSSGRSGDPDAAFREADGVVSLRLAEPRVVVNPMEPRAVVASYARSSNNLTLWDTTQAPHLERADVAQVLGIPDNKVRVIAIDVGGGFGCKHPTYSETYIAAILSMRLGRPVKWVEERQENFTSTDHGRGQIQYVEMAYKKDGTLLGMRVRFYTDLGAYCHSCSHASAGLTTPSVATGMYNIRNLSWTTYGVFTNKVSRGPYRGYGKAEPTYMLERVVDLVSRELGMDPAEVRRKNYIPTGEFPYVSAMGLEYDSGNYEAALDKALEIADYAGLKKEQKRLRDGGTLMGIGIASNVELSSFGPSDANLASFPGFESATVRVDPSGKVTILTGSSPHGQGHETAYAQIAADELGVPFGEIEVVWGDTAITPVGGMGTGATRSLVVGGTAIIKAGERVKEKAAQIAAALL